MPQGHGIRVKVKVAKDHDDGDQRQEEGHSLSAQVCSACARNEGKRSSTRIWGSLCCISSGRLLTTLPRPLRQPIFHMPLELLGQASWGRRSFSRHSLLQYAVCCAEQEDRRPTSAPSSYSLSSQDAPLP